MPQFLISRSVALIDDKNILTYLKLNIDNNIESKLQCAQGGKYANRNYSTRV